MEDLKAVAESLGLLSFLQQLTMLDPLVQLNELKEPKLHDWNIVPKNKKNPQCEIRIESFEDKKHGKCKGLAPITWTVSDLAKAGGLLQSPPLKVDFEDEQEMRRVYTLIYDVFRYKGVLMQALNDVSFFQIFPKLDKSPSLVWLLFYDLYHRSFKKRETSVAPQAIKLFDSAGLSFAENALWTQRVKLAASVARLRIKHNALCLSELLPIHLKDEKVTAKAKKTPVTCWVNAVKVRDPVELCKKIQSSLSLNQVEDVHRLSRDEFQWDKHCPQIISFHASLRSNLAKSEFVRNHYIIVQDKSFCMGAATFDKILIDLELSGSVIQTHINSPRATAYLANLLHQNEKIKRLMAFSAGQRKIEYETYFTQLGMRNIILYSDRLIDFPPDSPFMEEVVAIFATPPNSYSAVTDPIDLVCSRGGDLSMLEILTESEISKEGSERVTRILEEQRKTLKFAMSRPQIQFVLYETHSEIEAENDTMVARTIKDINKLAKIHHAALQGKISTPISQETPGENPMLIPLTPDSKEVKVEEELLDKDEEQKTLTVPEKRYSISAKQTSECDDAFLDNIQVPDTDIFDFPQLPNLCPSENACTNAKKEGCYLALLQRKEIIRLDDKYMIQMAENRGLFGSNTAPVPKSKSSRASRRKQEKAKQKEKPKRKLDSMEVIPSEESVETSSELTDEESFDEDSISELEEEYEYGTRDVGVDTSEKGIKNILGKLTSAHIRRLISPFFKDRDYSPLWLPSLYRKRILAEKSASEIPKKIPRRIFEAPKTPKTPTTPQATISKQREKKKKVSSDSVISQKPKRSSKNSISSKKGSKRRLGKKAQKKLFERLCRPTQCCIMRQLTESEMAGHNSNMCETRVFFCTQCKKRNEA